MRKISLRLLLPVLLLFAAFSCSILGTTDVTVTLGDATDPTAPIVVFGFSEKMQPDSVVGRADTSHLVVFQPELKGRALWIDNRTLVFYSAAPLPPSTSFTATFAPHVVAGGMSASLPGKVQFATPDLSITGSAAWFVAGSGSGSRVPVVELSFNYPVTSALLAKSLQFFDGKTNLTFNVIDKPASRQHQIRLITTTVPSGLQCTLKKGAVSSLGGNPSGVDNTVSIDFPEPGQLQIVRTETSFSGSEGIVAVVLSEPVDANTLAGNVAVEPFCLFRTEASSSGLVLRGSFQEGVNYLITVSRNVKSVFGGSMSYDLETNANFGNPAPSVAFAEESALYLGSKGKRNLGMYIRNTSALKIQIFRVYENNILHYMRQGKRWDWGEDEGSWYENYEYPFDEDYGSVIFDKLVDVKTMPSNGSLRLLNLPSEIFRDQSGAAGLYVVRVEADKKPWIRDVRLISFSNIGMLTMMNGTEMLVQAFQIDDGEPLEGAELQLISRNNQMIAKGNTGAGGLWVVKDFADKLQGFEPAMVVARFDNDFNCMILNNNRVETSRFDAGGRFLPKGSVDAFVYGERNIYRPGDSAHFAAVVRLKSWKPAVELPLILRITDATGREFLVRKKTTGSNGETALSFKIPAAAITGNWFLTLSGADGTLLNHQKFLVEEFQPDRISVQLSTSKSRYSLTEQALIEIAASSLLGPPAANAHYELEYKLSRSQPTAKGYERYNFYLTASNLPPLEAITTEGVTNTDGKAKEQFDFPSLEGTGMWRGTVTATVFDENDRPVIRQTGFNLLTQKFFVGVNNPRHWIATGQPHTLKLTAVDAEGKFKPDVNLEVEVKRVMWETVVIKQNNSSRYQSQRREVMESASQHLVRRDGDNWNFTPHVSGQYLLRFRVAGTNLWVEESVWAYGGGSTQPTSFGVNREGEIAIESDKENYEPGEKAKILLQTPFDGTVSVVIVQGDGSFDHHLVKSENKAASVEFSITKAMKPNSYVTATLIRRPDNSDLPLTVAHGMLNINVSEAATRLPVTIQAVEKTSSRTRQKVVVQTQPNALLTLAAVDEGILQLTSQPTPDPWGWFYGRRGFDASWYDLYAKLFPELAASFSSSGGDSDFDMSRRVNPFGNKQAKPAVWWSGFRKADASGKCSFNVPIPSFSGKLRLMAVGFKDEATGSAEKFMVVADPVVITAGLPPFLSPGDQLLFPVNLLNTTSKAAEASVKITTSGAVRLTSGTTSKVTLHPNIQNRVMASISAKEAVGEATVQIEVTANGQTHTETLQLNVRPAVGPVRQSGSGIASAANPKRIECEQKVLPGSEHSNLWLTVNPLGEFATLLNDLITYPYGCLEQTTSTAFPQLYLLDKGGNDAAFIGTEVTRNITEAVKRILSMQRYDGSFGYWPEAANPDWWATAYATHFLVEAGKAGFDVNNRSLGRALEWLNQQSSRYETESYGYLDANGKVERQLRARRETVYSLYVLALAGRPNLPAMNYYKDHVTLLTPDSRVVMAASFRLAGDKTAFGALMPGSVNMPVPVRTDGGSYYSSLSSSGWAINALITSEPNDQSVSIWLDALISTLRTSGWMSTFDKSQAMCALARFYKSATAVVCNADVVLANGKTIKFDGNDLVISRKENIFPVTLKVHGKGNLFYSWNSEGVGVEPVSPASKMLKVSYALLDRNGNSINRSVRHGELVVVRVGLQSLLPVTIQNVVVSDLLPACFEIENPRLAPGRDYTWMSNSIRPDQLDIRHDRINFFTTAYPVEHYFYYLARVIAAGEFTIGSTSAEAMYNGQYYAITASGHLVSVAR
ncbi:MAG: MG2 domain-containing protein [Bacteroidales bacterium]|nr:MG2 domain-containing protein [Bacteroidales bacterium]